MKDDETPTLVHFVGNKFSQDFKNQDSFSRNKDIENQINVCDKFQQDSCIEDAAFILLLRPDSLCSNHFQNNPKFGSDLTNLRDTEMYTSSFLYLIHQ